MQWVGRIRRNCGGDAPVALRRGGKGSLRKPPYFTAFYSFLHQKKDVMSQSDGETRNVGMNNDAPTVIDVPLKVLRSSPEVVPYNRKGENPRESRLIQPNKGGGRTNLPAPWLRPGTCFARSGAGTGAEARLGAVDGGVNCRTRVRLHFITARQAECATNQKLRCARCRRVPNAAVELALCIGYSDSRL
jgi:hypothetical protein